MRKRVIIKTASAEDTGSSARYRMFWLSTPSALERRYGRPLPHPQSKHLTSDELAQLSPCDLEYIAAAASRREARGRKWTSVSQTDVQ